MEKLNTNLIYEAFWDDEVFNALPQIITDSIDARSCLFHFVTKSNGHFAMAQNGQWSEEDAVYYTEHFGSKDEILNIIARPENQNKFHNAFPDLISQNQFLNSEIYKDFYQVIGDDMRNALGLCIDTPWGNGAIGIHRGTFSKPFAQEQIDFMQSFADDFKKMMILRGRFGILTSQNNSMQAMLDNFNFPSFLVNANGKIETMNYESEKLFSNNMLARNNLGYISFYNGNDNLYREAIAKATDARSPQANNFQAHSIDNIYYDLNIMPVPNVYGMRRAQVLIRPLKTGQTSIENIRTQHNLTNAETEIVKSLVEGKSVTQIADERQTTRGTLKSQLKSIFHKTNCNKQSQLIALVSKTSS